MNNFYLVWRRNISGKRNYRTLLVINFVQNFVYLIISQIRQSKRWQKQLKWC